MAQAPAKQQLPKAFAPLFQPFRYKAFHGGRGGAKSHSFAAALIIKGTQAPTRILCCREVQNSIDASVKQLLDDKIDALGLRWFYKSTKYEIEGLNGTKFLFKGLRTNAYSVKSMEGIDIVWVEEANTVSQTSLDLLIPTIRNEGSEIWFSWNRRFESDPVDNMFLGKDGAPPNSVVVQVNWDSNPWFPEVLRAEMEWDKKRDYDKYLHVWEGHPVRRSDSKVFRNWRIDDIDTDLPDGARPLLGADWGFSIDPTVLVECFIIESSRTLYFRREAWKIGCEIDHTPALFCGDDWTGQKRWKNPHGHRGIPSARTHPIVADSARPETISYLKKRGINVRKAIKGARSVEEGVEFMKSYDIVVHPSCTHVADEMATYSYKVDPLTDEVLPELADKDNHTIDACRYAVEATRRGQGRRVAVSGAQTVDLDNV